MKGVRMMKAKSFRRCAICSKCRQHIVAEFRRSDARISPDDDVRLFGPELRFDYLRQGQSAIIA